MDNEKEKEIKRKRLLSYGSTGKGRGCRNCIYRMHSDNEVASICKYDGLELDVTDVFAKVCKYWKPGKVA